MVQYMKNRYVNGVKYRSDDFRLVNVLYGAFGGNCYASYIKA